MSREEQLRIQALGAALSRRDWHATEQAYNAIRDEFDRRSQSSDHAPSPNNPELRAVNLVASSSTDQAEQLLHSSGRNETEKSGHQPPSRFAASTVEPVAFRWQGANGVWHLEKEQSESSDYEPLYAAPTTSPEPDQLPDNPVVSKNIASDQSVSSPEPDAVREAIKYLRDVEGHMMEHDIDTLMGDYMPPGIIADRLEASLSRPAHGGWEALKSIADFCSGDQSSLGAIARLAEVRRIASDALARNDRARPQPITDGAEK